MAVTDFTKLSGTLYSYNGGWSSGAIGSKVGYVSIDSSTAARTYLCFTVPAPSVGYKIETITLQIGLVYEGGGTTKLTGYLYTTELSQDQVSGPPEGYIASATTAEYSLSVNGENQSMTFEIPSNLRLTTAQTFYVWLCTSTKGWIQVWAEDNFSGSDFLVPRYKTTDVPAGVVNIYTTSGWKKAIPWIYTNGAWHQAIPYIYNNGWKNTC